jgi:hypothetical protein
VELIEGTAEAHHVDSSSCAILLDEQCDCACISERLSPEDLDCQVGM